MRNIPLVIMAGVLLLLAGCESAPRVRPVKLGPVDTGADSVEGARRQFLGTWELVTVQVFTPSGTVTPRATGRLTYDEFGNLSMQGTIEGSEQLDPSVLNLTGRVVIDPTTQSFRFQAIAASSADARRVDPKLDPAHVRYYEFSDGLLKTTVKDANGKATATATWKKID